jgi:predicted ABC-type ATPase
VSVIHPILVILAGPNGSGKSTAALTLLPRIAGMTEFVNADVIARGLSGFNPERAAIAAGRVMLTHVRELARKRVDFSFETTLASRSFAPWVEELKRDGYAFHLIYLWLPSAEVAIERVSDRVRLGGHNIPTDVIHRRYHAGLRNFVELYSPLATTWMVYNSSGQFPRPIALRLSRRPVKVYDKKSWELIDLQGVQR